MVICKNQVLRYLGYNKQRIDNNTNNLINECIKETYKLSRKSYVYKIFNIEKNSNSITFQDTTLTISDSIDIITHLAKSDKCVLMAASLGIEIDMKIAYYSKINLSKSLILDACASAAIESLCNKVQQIIMQESHKEGYYITERFSPGYGDLSIKLQGPICEILASYSNMGLTVNESNILIPRKSVTALIGLQKEQISLKANKCSTCDKKDCLYRKVDNNEQTYRL